MQTTFQHEQDLARHHIPQGLVYEIAKDRPLYYQGYKDYLNGNKSLEELMGSSYLQSFLIMAILKHLLTHLPESYQILTNELGIVYGEGDRRALDIAIYRKENLNGIPLDNKYLKVPPKVVIEVDTKADLGAFNTPMDYVYEKTDDLLKFGVEKVIWIFTAVRKVMIANQQERWIITNWSDPTPVIDNITILLEKMIEVSNDK